MTVNSGQRKRGACFVHGLLQNQRLVMSFRVVAGVGKYAGQDRAQGKEGGVRVIYFTRQANGEIWLLVIYSKAVKENIPGHILKAIREALKNE